MTGYPDFATLLPLLQMSNPPAAHNLSRWIVISYEQNIYQVVQCQLQLSSTPDDGSSDAEMSVIVHASATGSQGFLCLSAMMFGALSLGSNHLSSFATCQRQQRSVPFYNYYSNVMQTGFSENSRLEILSPNNLI